jgi:hypothetical protein
LTPMARARGAARRELGGLSRGRFAKRSRPSSSHLLPPRRVRGRARRRAVYFLGPTRGPCAPSRPRLRLARRRPRAPRAAPRAARAPLHVPPAFAAARDGGRRPSLRRLHLLLCAAADGVGGRLRGGSAVVSRSRRRSRRRKRRRERGCGRGCSCGCGARV